MRVIKSGSWIDEWNMICARRVENVWMTDGM